MRLVVAVADFDAAVAFYRDRFGLREQAAFNGDGDARVVILDAGRATLELANYSQKRMIDNVEAGGQESAPLRIAFQVDDATAATDALVTAGASLIAPPVETPWRSLNSRLSAPAGLELTLFQELNEPAPSVDEAAVRAVLERYIAGHATGDPVVMRSAFRPTAYVEGLVDGVFTSWDVDQYCALFGGSPADDESLRVRTIDSIDVVGTIATATMTLHHGASTFTDKFVLLNEGGVWLIANKVYHRHA